MFKKTAQLVRDGFPNIVFDFSRTVFEELTRIKKTFFAEIGLWSRTDYPGKPKGDGRGNGERPEFVKR